VQYEQARAWLQRAQAAPERADGSEVERLYAHLGRAYANQKPGKRLSRPMKNCSSTRSKKPLPQLSV